MAKRKTFNVKSTLNKKTATPEPELPKKVPLKKSSKNMEDVKERVEQIHQEAPSVPTPSTPKNPAKPAKSAEKLVRITVDTPHSVHIALKIKAIQEGITLRDYILRLMNTDLGL